MYFCVFVGEFVVEVTPDGGMLLKNLTHGLIVVGDSKKVYAVVRICYPECELRSLLLARTAVSCIQQAILCSIFK